MKSQFTKFTHKTPHLGKKQHQLDPNLDLKQLVHHAAVQYVDRDADGDVDIYDNPKKPVPDENPIKDFAKVSKTLMAKEKGELKHTRRGMAYEEWSEKYKKSIDCDNPKGFSQRAHCQGRKKKVNEDLRKWFGTGGEGGVGGGGWDRYNTKGERIGKCAREPGEGKPKCLSKEKAANDNRLSIERKITSHSSNRAIFEFDNLDQIPFVVGETGTVKTLRELQEEELSVRNGELLTYEDLRKIEYPTIGDQLDALYWARHGDDSHLKNIDANIAFIKDTYPKDIEPMTRSEYLNLVLGE